MFNFFKKYRLTFKILSVLVFAFGSCMDWIMYFNEQFENSKQETMKLFGGIIFGLMAIFQFVDLIELLRERKKLNRITEHISE